MNDNEFRMFKLASKGYCCTQTILKMALEDEGSQNNDIIRAANGLCGGVANTKGACGALTGGICVLGLYAGKGEDDEPCEENFSQMMQEYVEWFKGEFGSLNCLEIVEALSGEAAEGSGYAAKCAKVVLGAYEKAIEILLQSGYEYGERE